MFETHTLENEYKTDIKIKVIGIGGGGGNAINHMIRQDLRGIDFIAINTDAQDLAHSLAPVKFQLGAQLTRGGGAGGDPEVGREAALADADRIRELLNGAEMVFIAAGMGGGTGTGAAPEVAKIARELGALTVAVVTRPFRHETGRRLKYANDGIDRLLLAVDTLITIPNAKLREVVGDQAGVEETLRAADDVLYGAIRGVTDLIFKKGRINVDFRDIYMTMKDQGVAVIGVGTARGENRATDAAEQAIQPKLLDDISMRGAEKILVNVTAGPDLLMVEYERACEFVRNEGREDAILINGLVLDESIKDEIRVTVIATGFDQSAPMRGLSESATRYPSPMAARMAPPPRTPTQPAFESHRSSFEHHDDYDVPAVSFKD